jgi:hypothetical protein
MLDTIIAVAGLAIGYAAAIYSWPWLRTHVTGAVAEIDALRARQNSGRQDPGGAVMDWGDLAKQVIGLGAPLLGAALGGPLGGAAGEILAKALGSEAPTPAAVQASLPSADPAKLAEAESLWAETIRAEAKTRRTAIAETHATIRAEIESNDVVQRWWRPAYAWELALECGALWTVLLHEFWTGDVATINALIGAITLLTAGNPG